MVRSVEVSYTGRYKQRMLKITEHAVQSSIASARN